MTRATRLLLVFLLAGAVGVSSAGCSRESADEPPPPAVEPPTEPPAGEPPVPDRPDESSIAWLDSDLVDVQTGETFRISDFRG